MHISSRAIPLIQDNIDTDQIIPAKFLSITDKAGLGKHLFQAWRYHIDGSNNTDFVLNNTTYQGSILVTGANFGCGSSREHAAWAIKDYGFEAIIAPSFSDIFYNNALNNNLLAVVCEESMYHRLCNALLADPTLLITIDLETQSITRGQDSTHFTINPFKKYCLMTGKGNMDYILSQQHTIEIYEQSQNI